MVLNGVHFKNSFFYTFSCNSGKVLGKELIEKECLCFIGYSGKIDIWSTYIRPFVECANFGLIQFFNGYDTLSVINEMTEKYNQNIDKIYKIDLMIASLLLANRDALIMHGKNIRIDDLLTNTDLISK